MEPIVLLGLIVVAYGGYAALRDLAADLSVLFPRTRVARGRERCLQPPVKKMAGLYI